MLNDPRPRLALLLVLGVLAGCASGEPFDPPTADEIPPGPGLFTGKDGEFRLFRR